MFKIEYYDNNDEILNDEYIKIHEINIVDDVVNDNIKKYDDVDFLKSFEDEINKIFEVNDEIDFKIVDNIETILYKIYSVMRYKEIKSIKLFNDKYSFLSTTISINDIKYFLKYKINHLKNKTYEKIYYYNISIDILKDFFNVDNEDEIKNIINDLNIEIINNEKIIFNNRIYNLNYYSFNKYNLNDFKDDLFNYYYYIINNHQFNYHIINFDDINISSLDFLYNLYSYNYSIFNDEDNNLIYDLFNDDLLNKYDLYVYDVVDEDNEKIDEVYDDLYKELFNNIIYEVNEDLNDEDIIYKNRLLFINKDYLYKLNKDNDNEIYYYSCYYEIIKYDDNKLFEILLKKVNDNIDNYYDLIDIIEEYRYNNYKIYFDDFKRKKFNIEIDNYSNFYFYVKYHYDINLKKDDLIYV